MTVGYHVQNTDRFGNLTLFGIGVPKTRSSYQDLSLTNCNNIDDH